MSLSTDTIVQIGSMLVAGGAIYGGIKASISAMMRDIARNEVDIEKAHERLDNHLSTHHNRRKSDG